MSLGDIRVYLFIGLLALAFAGLVAFLLTLIVAALIRRLTGRDNAITRHFDRPH